MLRYMSITNLNAFKKLQIAKKNRTLEQQAISWSNAYLHGVVD